MSSREYEVSQLRDLESIGIVSDIAVVRQSERFEIYRSVIDELADRDLVYRCYCSRSEIAAASRAPHHPLPSEDPTIIDLQPEGAYPGTCRDLTDAARRQRGDRPAAVRLRSDRIAVTVADVVAGSVRAVVDDVVLQRGDGTPAYNLAVVVDDALQGVTQVVRGDDLLASTPRQVMLQRLLGHPTPEYLHVPLVVGDDGRRLAKRHGAVTLADLRAEGHRVESVVRVLLGSMGFTDDVTDLDDAVQAIERGDHRWTRSGPIALSSLGL